jgi:hypothetical protein
VPIIISKLFVELFLWQSSPIVYLHFHPTLRSRVTSRPQSVRFKEKERERRDIASPLQTLDNIDRKRVE